MSRNFWEMIQARWERGNFVCLNLTSSVTVVDDTTLNFFEELVRATHDKVCAYYVDPRSFLGWNELGDKALQSLLTFIRRQGVQSHELLPLVCEDMGVGADQGAAVASYVYDRLGMDAATVSPYSGKRGCDYLLKHSGKGVFVLCESSFSASDNENLVETVGSQTYTVRDAVLQTVVDSWNTCRNCGVILDPLSPIELGIFRHDFPELPVLFSCSEQDIPSYVRAVQDESGAGFLIKAESRQLVTGFRPDCVEQIAGRLVRLNSMISAARAEIIQSV